MPTDHLEWVYATASATLAQTSVACPEVLARRLGNMNNQQQSEVQDDCTGRRQAEQVDVVTIEGYFANREELLAYLRSYPGAQRVSCTRRFATA
jgi:hypothetical protein